MSLIDKFAGALQKRAQDVSIAASNNLFGSIAGNRFPVGTTKDFIPLDANGGIIDFEGYSNDVVQPVWLGLDTKHMQAQAYDYCSPLAAVIDRLAQADSNGRVEFVDEDGATIKNVRKIPSLYRVSKLLNNPNPLQTFEEFNSEMLVNCKKYGYCPVFALRAKSADPTFTSALIALDPIDCQPEYNWDFNVFSRDPKNCNPILRWSVNFLGQHIDIDAEDIILFKDGLTPKTRPNNFGLPKSKIEGLDYVISNICAAMEADNVLLKKKGPLGVFSHDAKPDMAGWTPMQEDHKSELQTALARYGLTWGQLQYVISKTPIKWNPMSFNVEELKTKDTIRMGTDSICDRLDYPAELMSGKNATYENRSSAERFLYQNNIIPFSLRKAATYCKFFKIEGLTFDYDHLPVLQEDVMKAGQAAYAFSEALLIDWEAGMISMAEYRIGKGLDTYPGQESYFYKDYIKDNPEMNKNKALAAPAVKPKKKLNGSSSKDTGTKK